MIVPGTTHEVIEELRNTPYLIETTVYSFPVASTVAFGGITRSAAPAKDLLISQVFSSSVVYCRSPDVKTSAYELAVFSAAMTRAYGYV